MCLWLLSFWGLDMKKIEDAITTGDVDFLENWLKTGGDPNLKNQAGKPLLHIAAISQKHSSLRMLLDYHADINQLDMSQRTALFILANMDASWELCMRELLYRGADPDICGKAYRAIDEEPGDVPDEVSPLSAAANKKDSLEKSRLLVEWGATVHTYSKLGYTPVFFASIAGNVVLVKYLLCNGAQLYDKAFDKGIQLNALIPFVSRIKDKIKNNKEELLTFFDIFTPSFANNQQTNARNLKPEMLDSLFHAAKIGEEETLERMLMRGAKIQWLDNSNNTLLHIAVLNNQFSCALFLLKAGCYVNSENIAGESPLMLAAYKTKIQTMRLLLDNMADIHQKNNAGATALHIISKYDQSSACCELLLLRGASLDCQDNEQQTPLMYACGFAKKHLVVYYVKKEAYVNCLDVYGETALFKAVKSRAADIVRYLLVNGADVNLINNKGETVLAIASEMGLDDIVKEILNISEPDNSCQDLLLPLESAKKNNFAAIVNILTKAQVARDNEEQQYAQGNAQRSMLISFKRKDRAPQVSSLGAEIKNNPTLGGQS